MAPEGDGGSRSRAFRATGAPRSPASSPGTPESPTCVGIDTRPPAERRRRHGLHRSGPAERSDLSPPSFHRGGHRRPLRDPLVSRARQAGSLPARLQRDRDAPAPRGVRADADARARRGARVSRHLRLRGRRAAVLPEVAGRRDAASNPVPARRLRARGLLRELRPPPPPDLGLHAALPARDRGRSGRAARPVPEPARGADPAGLRPAAPAPRRR